MPSFLTLETFKKKNGETINILEQIGAKYENFGIHLLDDSNGVIVDGIAANPGANKSANIKKEIVKMWTKGVGKPWLKFWIPLGSKSLPKTSVKHSPVSL